MEHLTVKAVATATDLGELSAIAATYDIDRVKDQIAPGAFERTIAQWRWSWYAAMSASSFHALWRVWEPRRGQEVPLAEVESFVRDLAGHFRVLAVVHDPHYFWHARQRLEDEVCRWSSGNTAGWRPLPGREIVAHGRLRHGGDPVARQHALAAEVKEREYGLILSTTATREPIDCLSALAMAVEWAASIEPPRPSVYEQRGLVVARARGGTRSARTGSGSGRLTRAGAPSTKTANP